MIVRMRDVASVRTLGLLTAWLSALLWVGCSDDSMAKHVDAGCELDDHDHDHAAAEEDAGGEADAGTDTASEHDHDEATDEGGECLQGTPTGATCPTGSTVTYDTFGKKFMDTYCVACHDSKKTTAAERHDAPLEHDFDTRMGVKYVADHVDRYAAGGPNAVNHVMPLVGYPQPSDADRKKLGEWLACGTK